MTFHAFGLVAATMIATSAASQTNTVTFTDAPDVVTTKLAGQCMNAGYSVLEITPTQVRCELTLSDVEKVNILFTKFHQRRFTPAVRMIASYTVIPSPSGSMAQGRVHVEAEIGGSIQTREDPAGPQATANILRQLGGE